MQLISILSDIPEGTFNFILELIIKIIIIILELSQIKKKSWTINKASLMDYSVHCTLTKRELFSGWVSKFAKRQYFYSLFASIILNNTRQGK